VCLRIKRRKNRDVSTRSHSLENEGGKEGRREGEGKGFKSKVLPFTIGTFRATP
jgi:hypothetical protein